MKNMFTNIDEKQTAKKVTRFFNNDYISAARLTGEKYSNIKAQNISQVAVKRQSAYNTDGEYIHQIEKNKKLVEFVKMVNYCIDQVGESNKLYRHILVEDCINQKPIFLVQQEIGYGRTQYFRFKKLALNSFADVFEFETGHDLHSFKNKD